MRTSMRLHSLTCLMVYASCAHAIMVKFGTKTEPIKPPPPEYQDSRGGSSLSSSQEHQDNRHPAPVWEQRHNDVPDPNAQWRPQLFVPQPRYTQVVFNFPESTAKPLNNAQRFVNSYLPYQAIQHQPIEAKPVQNLFTPAQILSSQNIPGFGIRYFVPAYLNLHEQRNDNVRHEDSAQNNVETNDVDTSQDSAHDLQWKLEKDASRRNSRHIVEATPIPYLWPAYVPRQY